MSRKNEITKLQFDNFISIYTKQLVLGLTAFFIPRKEWLIYAYDLEQRTPYQSQWQAPCLSFFHRDASVCIRGGSPATEYKTAHACRLGAFQLVWEWLDAFPLQLHNHTDSDWCLCIGCFSVLPLLLWQFQEAPAPSKAGKNDTGK